MKYKLRKWQKNDCESVAKYANNKNIADNLRNVFPFPYTFEDAEWYVNSCCDGDEKTQYCRAIEVDNKAVGSIGVFLLHDVYEKSAEIGYWLAEEFWGNGIMTDAIKQVCKVAFENYDIYRIQAQVFESNIASQKVLINAGFELEGVLKNSIYKNGKLQNSLMLAMIR